MAASVVSYLMFITVAVMVSATSFGAGSPMEKAFQDVRDMHKRSHLNRQVRDAGMEEAPCVSIPFLTVLKERFTRWLDNNNDGVATFPEVKEHLRRFKPNVDDAAVNAFIRRRDTNGNKAIDFVPEYVHDMSVPDYTTEGAQEWFNLQDVNDDGFVDGKELMDAAIAVGMAPKEAKDTAQNYYMVADVDKDGKLSFDEFRTLYSP